MIHRQDETCSRELAARWCALAERRLKHLIAMFESGRWRRYHSKAGLLENLEEARRAVEAWRTLAQPNALNIAADASALVSLAPSDDPAEIAAPPMAPVAQLAPAEQENEPVLDDIKARYPQLWNVF